MLKEMKPNESSDMQEEIKSTRKSKMVIYIHYSIWRIKINDNIHLYVVRLLDCSQSGIRLLEEKNVS